MIQVVKFGGKIATTHYTTLEIYPSTSLVECKLDTGRTHQIRVHMSHLGHSIFGDPVYGNHKKKVTHLLKVHSSLDEQAGKVLRAEEVEVLMNFNRQALHSCYIEFMHPVTDVLMNFASELSEDMMRIKEILRKIN